MTNEIINLLHKFSPATLLQLRETLGDTINLDLAWEPMGGKGEPIAEETDSALGAEAELALTGLRVADDLCKMSVPILATSVRRSKMLQLCAQIAAAVGSVGLLGTLASTYTFVKYMLAALTLVASVASIASQWMLSSLNPIIRDLPTAYGNIIDDRYEVSRLIAKIELGRQTGDTAPFRDAVDRSNVVCRDVNRLVSAIGIV